jgi:hypothetical protein
MTGISWREVMVRAGSVRRVVLEAAYGWYWAVDALAELGASVTLAYLLSRRFPIGELRMMNVTPRTWADLLRMGRLPEAWITRRRLGVAAKLGHCGRM